MDMEYRRLGKSGLKLSALSFGAWITFGDQVGDDTAEACMHEAYDLGMNFFDNAEAYSGGKAEEVMGRILARSGWDRDSFCVSSKVMFGAGKKGPTQRGLSRKHVIEACHQALQRLQVEYLDLYFCHRPDPETPIEETVRAMNTLIEQGKVLYWGTSEWSAVQILQADQIARENHLIGPTMEQPQYNMLHRDRFEKEYAPLYSSIGLGTTVWSPLASGILTGKYNDGLPEDSRLALKNMQWLRDELARKGRANMTAKVRSLASLASDLGTSPACFALAWCLKNPNVSTLILGASRPEQLRENVGALEVLPKITPEVLAQVESILNPEAEVA